MSTQGLTADHDVLTTIGWVPIDKITTDHLVCVLEDEQNLNYVHPETITHSQYQGEMYVLQSERVDLTVTLDTLLYVKMDDEYKKGTGTRYNWRKSFIQA